MTKKKKEWIKNINFKKIEQNFWLDKYYNVKIFQHWFWRSIIHQNKVLIDNYLKQSRLRILFSHLQMHASKLTFDFPQTRLALLYHFYWSNRICKRMLFYINYSSKEYELHQFCFKGFFLKISFKIDIKKGIFKSKSTTYY